MQVFENLGYFAPPSSIRFKESRRLWQLMFINLWMLLEELRTSMMMLPWLQSGKDLEEVAQELRGTMRINVNSEYYRSS